MIRSFAKTLGIAEQNRRQQDSGMRLWQVPTRFWRLTLLTGMGLCLASSSLAQSTVIGKPGSVVTISTFWSQTGVKAGGQINLAVVLDIQKPYHVNSHLAKEPYIPLNVQLVGAPSEVRGT